MRASATLLGVFGVIYTAAAAAPAVHHGGDAIGQVAALTQELRSMQVELEVLALGGRRALQMGGMGGMGPSPPPTSKDATDMEAINMDEEAMAMVSGMRSTLYRFTADERLVLLVDGWSVESYRGYFVTLVVLFVWSVAHEWLAQVRSEVAAGARSPAKSKKSKSLDGSDLGEPLAAIATVATLAITGMTCDGCASRIQGALTGMDAVESVEISYASGIATVVGAVVRMHTLNRIRPRFPRRLFV